MRIKITKEKPKWSNVGHGKHVIIVEFPNCISEKTQKPFKWLPTYEQLKEIRDALEEIEKESWR